MRSLETWDNAETAVNERLERLLTVAEYVILSNEKGPGGARLVRAKGNLEQTPYAHVMVAAEHASLVVVCEASWPLLKETTAEWSAALVRDFDSFLRSVRVDGSAVFSEASGVIQRTEAEPASDPKKSGVPATP